MAPNKKKKKAAANPGRGFATTSIPSKSKPQDNIIATTEKAEPPTLQPADEGSPPHECSNPERELHQLTPDELEYQLEESELQLFIEKHGAMSKKSASHQAMKLITEKRILRPQAEELLIRSWLPEELMDLMHSYVNAELHETTEMGSFAHTADVMKTFSEDEMTVRLWTLEQTLLQMRFSAKQARDAITFVMTRKASGPPVAVGGKDSIWGLNECLDWLALTCDTSELPSYEITDQLGPKELRLASIEPKQPNSIDTPDSSPPLSRPPTPPLLEKVSLKSSENVTHVELAEQSSESESDTDPEALTTKYLTLKKKLYDLRPGLADMLPRKSSKRAKQTDCTNSDPRITKLQRKIADVESDILFERDEAEFQWVETRKLLAKEAAERNRLHLGDAKLKGDKSQTMSALNTDSMDTDTDADDIEVDMLADLFLSTGTESCATNPQATNLDDKVIIVRDFGKFSGLKPRRVLEDACKARDAGSQAMFQVISSSPFNIRYSVIVKWSRIQPTPLSSPITAVTCKADQSRVRIEMDTIATRDNGQSEAYVATVALFLIFAASTKEEKVYLRLPGVWRDLWSEFAIARREQNDASDRQVLREIRQIVADCGQQPHEQVEPKIQFEENGANQDTVAVSRSMTAPLQSNKNSDLKNLWVSKASAPSFQRMVLSRKELPIWIFKSDILDAIEANQVIIICGETGCGKSTQVPSFILESELTKGRPCKVYCTEPRRISAISLARRVCEELGERKGDVGTTRSLVGYAIRLESKITPYTRLVYATTGIVMRMLERSNDLDDITHLVLDEVHERTIDSDFLLIILRRLMARRPSLRLILMSATVNAQRFSDYLAGAPILNVPGRTYPVETKYLEDAVELTGYQADGDAESMEIPDAEDIADAKQVVATNVAQSNNLGKYSVKTRDTLAALNEYQIPYDLVVRLIETISISKAYMPYSKAVLVFLPGIAEIRRLHAVILGSPTFGTGWHVYPLHSTIATEEQERAFLVPPEGTRKIVLATNIAETGITIPDVTCVIDTGKHKEMRFDERRQLSRLVESFISRANAKQRRGRAGRVQNGLCFHLFTKARHDTVMAEEQVPEMLRLSLQDLVLRVKICNLGEIEATLSDALDPPSSKNVRRAIDSLVDVKALTAYESLTPLGRQLAKLPLDVFLGKLILLGSIFQCLDGALTIAAILSSKSPFSAPMGSRAQADLARRAFKRSDSDLLTVYNAYCAWRYICNSNNMPEFQFCRKNCLSQQTLSNIEDLKAQLTGSLSEAGFIQLSGSEKAALNRVQSSRGRHFVEIPSRYSINGDNDLILHSVIGWSFYPKLLKGEGKGWRNVANNQSVSLAPTSVNKGLGPHPRWLSFYHIMQSGNKFYNAHETSSIEDFAVALVCGEAEFKMYSGVIVIDGHRVRFCVDGWWSMLALKYLRIQIRQIMTQAFRFPGRELTTQQQAWFELWHKIFFLNAVTFIHHHEPFLEQPSSSPEMQQPVMDRERRQELMARHNTSPREILAQNQLRNHLQRRDSQYELYTSGSMAVLSNLTIQGIISLRSGPFTLLPYHTPDIDLRNITDLNLAVVPFGEPEPKVVTTPMKKDEDDSFAAIHAGSDNTSPINYWPSEDEPSGIQYTHEQRTGYKILHDFLAGFPPTQVTSFRFEWIGRLAGPNPLLLHNLAVEATGRDDWFSAPPLTWKALHKLRFKGVDLKDEDVAALRRQHRQLKSLVVETFWTEEQIAQGLVSDDPEDQEVDVLAQKNW